MVALGAKIYARANRTVETGLDNELKLLTDRKAEQDHVLKQIYTCRRPSEVMKSSKVVNMALGMVLSGDDILYDMRECLGLRHNIESHQRTFMEAMLQSNIPQIFGDDYAANEFRLKHQNNIHEIFPFSLICCPRRWGKTYATAWFVACALTCMHNIKVSVFSPAQRQSQEFVTLVK